MALVLRQGLWAWTMLAPSDDDGGSAAACVPETTSTTLPLTLTVCSELFAAWTDLLVSTVRRQGAL